MPRRDKTARHKLNGSHVHGALIVAALVGAMSGSWVVFAITGGVLLATSLYDGSIRL